MQKIVERWIGRLQVKEKLSHLILAKLIACLHWVQRFQPRADFAFALEILWNDRQTIHGVN